jgi:hypothetical protein
VTKLDECCFAFAANLIFDVFLLVQPASQPRIQPASPNNPTSHAAAAAFLDLFFFFFFFFFFCLPSVG